MINEIKFLALKEWRELIGDYRSLTAAFMYVALGPALLFMLASKWVANVDAEPNLDIAVIEHNIAARIVSHIELNGHTASIISESQRDQFDLVIEARNKPHSNGVHLYLSGAASSDAKSKQLTAAQSLINQFVHQENRFAQASSTSTTFEPAITLSIHTHDAFNAQQLSLLRSLMIFILMAPFVITLAFVSDTLGGERERGALAQTSLMPVSSASIVLAKYLAGVAMGLIGTFATLSLGLWLIGDLPLYKLGFSLQITPVTIVAAIAWLTPFVALIVALQMFIAMTAASFKESQNYLSMLSFAPMLSVFMNDKVEGLALGHWIPLVQQQKGLMALFSEQAINWQYCMVAAVVCLSLAAAALLVVNRELQSEKLAQFI